MRIRLIALMMLGLITTLYYACGSGDEFNLWQPVAEDDSLSKNDHSKLEEAKVLMDEGKYEDSRKITEKMLANSDQDSNEARLLYAGAKLGESGLDVWNIITNILDGTSGSKQSSGGIDSVLDSFSDGLIGEGENPTNSINALKDAVGALLKAPNPDDNVVVITGCVLAAILAIPTMTDAQTALNNTTTALSNIQSSAESGGESCPDINQLTLAMDSIADVSESFGYILSIASGCPFLNLGETEALMNSVQAKLSTIIDGADKGCDDLPTCPPEAPNCQDLFPTCVKQALNVGSSDAGTGDGKVASCELILHCTAGSSCF